jgi:hypothetical protein
MDQGHKYLKINRKIGIKNEYLQVRRNEACQGEKSKNCTSWVHVLYLLYRERTNLATELCPTGVGPS